MIYLYTGTPGSGKSYHVAKDIFFWLQHGRNIIANFDINYDSVPSGKFKKKGYFFERDNFDLTAEWLIDFGTTCHEKDDRGKIREHQTWIIIDECQLIFNCRSWNDRARQPWMKFFTLHRKLGFDIILISQFDRMIDRQIRSLVEYEVKHRKINNFGTGGFFVSLFTLGRPVFAAIEYWYGVKERTGMSLMIGRKKYYELYDSYKIFDSAAG
jgi:zona occludens toxin (predicted ATPase)